MARRHTVEGARADRWPRNPDGARVPARDLTWVDQKGRPLLDRKGRPIGENLTYDHHPPVVRNWNERGRFEDRRQRNAWYHNPDHLRPMSRSDNSSSGSKLKERFAQETGDGYSRD